MEDYSPPTYVGKNSKRLEIAIVIKYITDFATSQVAIATENWDFTKFIWSEESPACVTNMRAIKNCKFWRVIIGSSGGQLWLH